MKEHHMAIKHKNTISKTKKKTKFISLLIQSVFLFIFCSIIVQMEKKNNNFLQEILVKHKIYLCKLK